MSLLVGGSVSAVALGMLCHLLSLGHLSDDSDARSKAAWLGIFAPRRAFAAPGWHLHLASIGFTVVAMVLLWASSFP